MFKGKATAEIILDELSKCKYKAEVSYRYTGGLVKNGNIPLSTQICVPYVGVWDITKEELNKIPTKLIRERT